MIKTLQSLHRLGVLGMNHRNARYILPNNPRHLYPSVDNKLITKRMLQEKKIPTPELYLEIKGNYETRHLSDLVKREQFVIKPARGAEGRGILVIVGRQGEFFKTAGQKLFTLEDLQYHITNILAGLFSLGGSDDEAFVEYCVMSHHAFDRVAFRGVPDIRVILYRGVPVMAMLRLPTQQSQGKANLHQGAVGAGVDMLTGRTLGGVLRNRMVDLHPDTKEPIAGLEIPFWADILASATRTYDLFKLGYMGVDFVVDRAKGPMILELNARPGLNIQIANRAGLLPRLEAVNALPENPSSWPAEKRIEISMELLRSLQSAGR